MVREDGLRARDEAQGCGALQKGKYGKPHQGALRHLNLMFSLSFTSLRLHSPTLAPMSDDDAGTGSIIDVREGLGAAPALPERLDEDALCYAVRSCAALRA